MHSSVYECACVCISISLFIDRANVCLSCSSVPQRQEPSSCCTSSSLVWQRWQRLRLRCLEPLRDAGDDDDADKDDNDDEESSLSGTAPTLARFSGETSLSDSEAGDKCKNIQQT